MKDLGFLVIGQELNNTENILDNLTDGHKIFFIDYTQDINEKSFGRFIDINDFYCIASKVKGFASVFIKDPIIIKNGSNISLDKGEYNIFQIDKILEK